MHDIEQGTVLLHLARAAIARELGFHSHELPHGDWLTLPGATFITLTLHGQLRGCIGSLELYRPLLDDVRHNAVAAAFRDPRFMPLSKAEFAEVVIEVSWLGTPQVIRFESEEDACAQLQPGRDGVILEYGRSRATYLPQVWTQLPDSATFLGHLKEKAGLSADFWSGDIRLSRYTVRKFSEDKKLG